jgi:hypothetical protein
MYDKYLIVAEAFQNVVIHGEVYGFQLGMRLPYYRGVVLSLIGKTNLTVDGEAFSPEAMSVTLHGREFPISNLENEADEKWEFGEIGILTVRKPGGLKPGKHLVELDQHMKISYVPFGFNGHDKKELILLEKTEE